MLKIECTGSRRLEPADLPAELGHIGPDARLGEHRQPERQRRRGDVVTALDRQRQGDRVQIAIVEPPVLRGPATGHPAGRAAR